MAHRHALRPSAAAPAPPLLRPDGAAGCVLCRVGMHVRVEGSRLLLRSHSTIGPRAAPVLVLHPGSSCPCADNMFALPPCHRRRRATWTTPPWRCWRWCAPCWSAWWARTASCCPSYPTSPCATRCRCVGGVGVGVGVREGQEYSSVGSGAREAFRLHPVWPRRFAWRIVWRHVPLRSPPPPKVPPALPLQYLVIFQHGFLLPLWIIVVLRWGRVL